MLRVFYIFALIFPIVFSQKPQNTFFNCTQLPKISDDFDVSSCCRKPKLNLDAANKKCEAYILAKQQRVNKTQIEEYPPYAHVCFPECIYRETGALVDDEIVIPGIRKFLETNLDRKDFKEAAPQIVKSFETCVGNIKAHMKAAGLEKYELLPGGCSPFASLLFTCVNVETFIHCPPAMWKDEDSCNVARSFVERCNPLPHVPLPANDDGDDAVPLKNVADSP